ncbi:hypothetical protein ACIGXM_14540 [Kitasatospora sp. NPDC052896]|uniref:hypothetical protein n=1 Tax=Kitasatospora sp. NPDC052896 TaxID=3364061 RepID=UPI0037C7F580
MPPIFFSQKAVFFPFGTNTEGRELPWLLITLGPKASVRTAVATSGVLLNDGWQPVALGDTPEIDTWCVRIVDDAVYIRQRGLEPLHVHQDQAASWRAQIMRQKSLSLVYNPVSRLGGQPESSSQLYEILTHRQALCARVPLS